MKRIYISFVGLAIFCVVVGVNTSVKAQGFAVQGEPTAFETDIEPSAVEPIGTGKFLLVANDKHAELLIVDAQTKAIADNKLSLLSPDAGNPKWEAMAKDGNDYYIVGNNCLCLLRFSLKSEDEEKAANIAIKEPPKRFPLQKISGGRIEGLAVWVNDKSEKELVFGVRDEPGLKTIRTYRAKITDNPDLSLVGFFTFSTKKTKTQPVEWHLSSIEYVQALDGFLIITSTEDMENKFYGNKLWFVSREKLRAAQPNSSDSKFKDTTTVMIESEVFEPMMKAEGLAILQSNENKKLKIVIVFDNDYSKTHKTAKLIFVDLDIPIK